MESCKARERRIRRRLTTFAETLNMKNYVKVSAVAAVILALTAAGVSEARAGGWPIAAGVVGGFAAGTIVGAAIAQSAPPPAYCVYPQPFYAAPVCAPVPWVIQPAPVYYSPVPVVYPCYYSPARLGAYFGRPYFGRPYHYFRRR